MPKIRNALSVLKSFTKVFLHLYCTILCSLVNLHDDQKGHLLQALDSAGT